MKPLIIKKCYPFRLGVYEYSDNVNNAVLKRSFRSGDKAVAYLKRMAKNGNKRYFMASYVIQ